MKKIEKRINITSNAKRMGEFIEGYKNDFKHYFRSLLNQPQLTKDIYCAAALYKDEYLDKDITFMEVEKTTENAKINKAPGEDRIPYELLKFASTEFLLELTKI